ncbi:retinal pigment epithelial membrane protein-domain-containing protein [Immersiella caudata]|uniref:Retinal pigment epithelial membrane protein-domain-containing protein n=1 Tax=Immersiella caudata TaxID=314043 RepID=A0AA39X4T6_9PEZI|nr:retinal pigment epithelial membrane protein-domain-containing protein [Immersiella caudata]
MGSTYTPQGTTIRLTPADETASLKAAYCNMAQKAYEEWPNEAGFEGLTAHRGPVELKVNGNIPVWAAGSLYRTGPGQNKVEDTKSGAFHLSHWFDGLAHTHKFDIVPGGEEGQVRVFYSSRRQSDKVAADIKASGALHAVSFAQRMDPCIGMFGKVMSVFTRRPDRPFYNVGVTVGTNLPSFQEQPNGTQDHRTTNTNIVIGTDASVMCEMDPKTLETISFPLQSKFHPDLKGALGAAHGLTDPETGDYFNYNLELAKQPLYRIFCVSATTNETAILATIPFAAAFIHSFFLTSNYIILCIPAAHYEWSGLKILWTGNLHDAFKPFDPSETCHWFVIDKHHGKGVVAEFTSPARFFFHAVNAFEDEETGDILCELVDYPNRYILDAYYYDVILNRKDKAKEYWTDGQLEQKSFPRLTRYRLRKQEFVVGEEELPTAEIVMEIPSPHAGDMPVINPLYQGKKHRYGYILVSRVMSTLFEAIAKVDTETRELLQWQGPKGHTPGEAIFVPRPAGDGEALDEDDGVLLSVVLDGENRRSYLLCLDAKTMTELGSAEYGTVHCLHNLSSLLLTFTIFLTILLSALLALLAIPVLLLLSWIGNDHNSIITPLFLFLTTTPSPTANIPTPSTDIPSPTSDISTPITNVSFSSANISTASPRPPTTTTSTTSPSASTAAAAAATTRSTTASAASPSTTAVSPTSTSTSSAAELSRDDFVAVISCATDIGESRIAVQAQSQQGDEEERSHCVGSWGVKYETISMGRMMLFGGECASET